MAQYDFYTDVEINGSLTVNSLEAGIADYDAFVVSDGGVLKFRTGSQVLSDIGGTTQNLTIGTDNQIPFVNLAGNDFEYDTGFTFDGAVLDIVGQINLSQTITGTEDLLVLLQQVIMFLTMEQLIQLI